MATTAAQRKSRRKNIGITLGVGAGIGATLIIWRQWGKWQEKQAQKKRLKERKDTDCQGVNLSAVAFNIYDALWDYMGGLAEDEETAVNELLRVPKSCIPDLADLYMKDFQKNLYEDFRTYVEGSQYEQVRHLLEDGDRTLHDLRRQDVYELLYTPNPYIYV